MVSWEKIKTEYVSGRASYRELSEKYAVPYSTLKTRGRCEQWVEERKRHQEKVAQKSLELIGDRQAQDLARVDTLADEMLSKLETAIDQLDLVVIQHKEKGETEDCKWEKTYEESIPGGMIDRAGLRQLAACLKDLKQAKAIQSELEKTEQEARIRKLQRECQDEQAGDILISIAQEAESYCD